MKYQMRFLQGWKLAAVVAVALSMGACAKNNVGADGAMAKNTAIAFARTSSGKISLTVR